MGESETIKRLNPPGDKVRVERHKLFAAEWQCCGFVAWEVEDLGDEVILTVRGDTDGVTAMA